MVTYTMEAKENYDPTRAAQADGAGFPVVTYVDSQLIGHGFDANRRELVYAAIIGKPAVDGVATNDSGHDLWDGQTAILAGATFSPAANWAFHLARKNIDTGVVTFYDAYDPDSLVPSGIYGDGTARRYVSDTAGTRQYPILTDPRTSDAWVLQESCDLYVFRAEDDWTMHISPLRPVGASLNHVIPRGMNDDWVYVVENPTVDPTRNLYLVPRLTTADETTADELLAYATYAMPSDTFEDFMTFSVDGPGDLWLFASKDDIDNIVTLHKFTQPSVFVYPTPPVDGGWADKTPWTDTTGPNELSAICGINSVAAMFSHARTQLNLLNGVRFTDPDLSVDTGAIFHTWYLPADDSWGTTTIARGYMTAAFVQTEDPEAAAFLLTGTFQTTNIYLDVDNYDGVSTYTADDYAARWLFVEVQVVEAGVATGEIKYVLVQLTWASEAGPVLAPAIGEEGWDTTYSAYGAAIGNASVVHASVYNEVDFFKRDIGIFDPDTTAFWFSGRCAAPDNLFYLDAAFTARIGVGAQPPLLRLSFSSTPPPGSGRRPVGVSIAYHRRNAA